MPQKPGVYRFLDENNEVLYVGKAVDLKKRVSSYFTNKLLGGKTKLLVSKIATIKISIVESELDALLLEANEIKKYTPWFNTKLTDGKAYPLIRITIQDPYPKVLIARRAEDKKSEYFGPYPNSGAVKSVLKTIRHIFPYESFAHRTKKHCLYYHLGLCPCAEISDSEDVKKAYRKNIFYIIHFLEGKRKTVVEDLEKERDSYSNEEQFEKSKEIQKQIDAILYITSHYHLPVEYDANPNLRGDLRQKELDELQNILKKKGTLVNNLQRIECYDISNIQGFHAVGSMVVLINGEKEVSMYRRFKIRFLPKNKPNDFAMMEEVFRRRLKHKEWDFPNLIIVDGGKGQISSAKKALVAMNVSIPLVGLAKREETIITEDFKEISLPKDSPVLHLLMRIRDEAHRFAITYHRKLRAKNSLL